MREERRLSDDEDRVTDLSSPELPQVLNEIGKSIRWLGTFREKLRPEQSADQAMAAVSLQVKCAEVYRSLLQTIDTDRRVEAMERWQANLMGKMIEVEDLLRQVIEWRERLKGGEP